MMTMASSSITTTTTKDKAIIPIILTTCVLLLLLFPTATATTTSSSSGSSSISCDSNSHPSESTKASQLTPNTFHKLCPSTSSLGPPICGDGVTPFSFYYTSPVQRHASRHTKILVEFLGGGACWDSTTCDYNSGRLTFPYAMDNYLDLSCSEIQAGLNQQGGQGGGGDENNSQDVYVNMLCAQPMTTTTENSNDLDFREYHTVIVPYCTQDVHTGDNTITYTSSGNGGNGDDDGSTTRTVHHRGARNVLSVLEWIYTNFPHPDHIFLTGCSAGGTVLPVVYDLLHHHYNSWTKGGGRHHGLLGHNPTAISTLMDSPVYLTPTYFLQEGLPHWNVEPVMKKLQFNYNKYVVKSQTEDYSYNVFRHVLKRGSKQDPFGMITHSSDPVSLAYFERMSKSYDDDDDNNNNNDDDMESEWWSQLSKSFETVTNKYSNTHTYLIDGYGHCSFGLYYALEEGGDDFRSWAGTWLRYRNQSKPSSSCGRGWFWISALIGCGCVVGASFYQHHEQYQKQQQQQQQQQDAVQNTPWYELNEEEEDDDADMTPTTTTTTTPGRGNGSGYRRWNRSGRRSHRRLGSIRQWFHQTARFLSCQILKTPVTSGYGIVATVYFLRIMTWNRGQLETILYNPSIGPSAATLSVFGINNPTLIVYHGQILRALLTSTFLCSGIITYTMVLYSLYRNIRPLEQVMRLSSSMPSSSSSSDHNDNDDTTAPAPATTTISGAGDGFAASKSFLEVSALISIGSNLLYACLVRRGGASCSSLALILGLQTFSCTIHRYHQQVTFPRPLTSTHAMFWIPCLLLPFNSWIMMLSAMILGASLAIWVYVPLTSMSSSMSMSNHENEDHNESSTPSSSYKQYLDGEGLKKQQQQNNKSQEQQEGLGNTTTTNSSHTSTCILTRHNRLLQGLLTFFAVLWFLLVVRIRRPDRMYEQPFLTGCELVYTTKVGDIVNGYLGDRYYGNDNNNGDENNGNNNNRYRKRWLEEEENDNNDEDETSTMMCTQFCVPHIVSRPFVWGANLYTGFDVQRGWCEEVGYGQHIADKTFSYKSYSIDVELYYDDNYSNQNNNGGDDEEDR